MGKAKPNTAPEAVAGDVTSISAAAGKRSNASIKATAEAKPSAVLPPEAALVVFGRDDGGKPHASWFSSTDAELATKAAGLMRFKVLPITTDEHRAAATGLAAGRVFASGRAFSPFCKESACAALEAFPEAYRPVAPVEPEPEPARLVTGTPQRWEDLAAGSLVLASVGPGEGWFEAVIAEAKGEAIFVLKWQGWPEEQPFVRRADGLALLPARSLEPISA